MCTIRLWLQTPSFELPMANPLNIVAKPGGVSVCCLLSLILNRITSFDFVNIFLKKICR